MRIDVFTIFPDLVSRWLDASLIGRARRTELVDLRVHDLRSAATDPHRSVDDTTFGGGAGMVLAPGPVFGAVEAVKPPRPLFLLDPGGRRFDQAIAQQLAAREGFSLLSGRYEGVDQRVTDHLVDAELSLGDFVLAGGEVAALAIIEAVVRLVPGVMGNEASTEEESFTGGLLEYPQYTRPAEFRGWVVPAVLRSGDHGKIARWRRAQSLARTRARRPDLLAARGGLTDEERELLVDYVDNNGRRNDGTGATAGWRIRDRILYRDRFPTRPRREAPRHESEHRAMNPTDLVDQGNVRSDVPDFAPGDTLKVHVRVVEGNRERVQLFQGPAIRRQGSGVRETFTVRKVSFGVGVERTFPVHSPVIAKIEVLSRGDVRRAKLYYLRERTGKAAKIREKRTAR